MILDAMAKRYGVLPHVLLDTDWESFQINMICYEAAVKEEIKQQKANERKMKRR